LKISSIQIIRIIRKHSLIRIVRILGQRINMTNIVSLIFHTVTYNWIRSWRMWKVTTQRRLGNVQISKIMVSHVIAQIPHSASVHGLDSYIGPPNPERAPRCFIVDISSTIIRSREMRSKGMLRKVED